MAQPRFRAAVVLGAAAAAALAAPIAPSSVSPRWLAVNGSAIALVGDGEHYGAVLNLQFNFSTYLDTLRADGLNLLRLWTGAWYLEPPGEFGIVQNTLAPAPGSYLAPWATAPGSCCYNNTPGLPKYDLTAFNATYFARLRAFLVAAQQAGIFVHLDLGSVFYNQEIWQLSPLHPSNNVNGIGGNVSQPNDIYKGLHPEVEAVQHAFAVRLLQEVGDLDNFFIGLINEPYDSGDLLLGWQSRMAAVVAAADSPTAPHTIEQNWGHASQRIYPGQPAPQARMASWHYTYPLTLRQNALAWPWVMGTSETGFQIEGDEQSQDPLRDPYRILGWQTMLSGAGYYQNLDYSFTVGSPNGTAPIPAGVPGGGGPLLRKSLGILGRTLNALPLDRVGPALEEVFCASRDDRMELYVVADILVGGLVAGTLNLTVALAHVTGVQSWPVGMTFQLAGPLPWAQQVTAAGEQRSVQQAGTTAWNVTAIDTLTGETASLVVNGLTNGNGQLTFSVPAPASGAVDAALLLQRIA